MLDFDKKLKKIAKNEEVEIPINIENKITNTLNSLEGKHKKSKYLKVAIIFIAFITAITATQTSAFETIINYFKGNTESAYFSMKEDIEQLGEKVGKSSKDKDIELIVDSVSIDGNFANVFYTIRGKHKVEKFKEVDALNYMSLFPIVDGKINNKDIPDYNIQYEYKIISDNEIRCMRRFNVGLLDLKDNIDLTIYTDSIYDKQGRWKVSFPLDISKSMKETLVYDINKNEKIEFTDTEGKEIKYNIDIEKVMISPFGSQIVINRNDIEKMGYAPQFALFDQNGKALKILDKGGPFLAKEITEFRGANKDLSSLTLVPYVERYDIEDPDEFFKMEPVSIENLPVEIKVSDYGSVIIEDVNISDKKITTTYSTKGIVNGNDGFTFYDENGEAIDFACMNLDDELKEEQIGAAFLYEPIYDIKTGKSSVTMEFYVGAENLDKIKKISTYKENIKLMEDAAVTINLK